MKGERTFSDEVMQNANNYLTQFISGDLGGIPADELAFLQEANSDAEQSKIEKAMRDAEDELRAIGLIPEDAAEFVTRQIEEPVWIIPDMLAKHYQAALYGKSKSKKTFFGLQLSLSVATGTPFLKWQINTPHNVAYFNLELMPYFFQERMRKQLAALNLEYPKDRLTIFNLRGRAELLRETVNLRNDSPFVKYIKTKNIDLAVIDPRYKLMQGQEDENTAAGLRALLKFRTALADACAVLLIGHDPKSDISGKEKVSRGAGSYTAIADDDATFLLTPNTNGGEGVDAVTVQTIHRNRAAVPDFTATFDADSLTFSVDDSISPDTNLNKPTIKLSGAEKARRNAERAAGFKQAALDVADAAGDNLLGVDSFKTEISKRPAGAIGKNALDQLFKVLIQDGVLAKQAELERKPNGEIKNRYHGDTFVSTPERIERYRAQFDNLGI